MRTLGVALVLVPVVAIAGCGSAGGGPAMAGGDAARLKARMDEATRALVPQLRKVIGEEVVTLRGRFTGCQVAGTWRYVVDGQLKGVPSDPAVQVAEAKSILEAEGWSARMDGQQRVTADAEAFTVAVTPGRRGSATAYALGGLWLESDCAAYEGVDADLAEQGAQEDFADLVQT